MDLATGGDSCNRIKNISWICVQCLSNASASILKVKSMLQGCPSLSSKSFGNRFVVAINEQNV